MDTNKTPIMEHKNTGVWIERVIKVVLFVIFIRMLFEFDNFYELAKNSSSVVNLWNSFSLAWIVMFVLFLAITSLYFKSVSKFSSALKCFSVFGLLMGLWKVFLLQETITIIGIEAYLLDGFFFVFLRYSLLFFCFSLLLLLHFKERGNV